MPPSPMFGQQVCDLEMDLYDYDEYDDCLSNGEQVFAIVPKDHPKDNNVFNEIIMSGCKTHLRVLTKNFYKAAEETEVFELVVDKEGLKEYMESIIDTELQD